MNTKQIKLLLLLLTITSIASFLGGCDKDDDTTTGLSPSDDIQTVLQTELISAVSGDVIELGAGTFTFEQTLTIDGINNLTLKGQGRTQTILDFSNQVAGAEGVKVTGCNMFLIEGLTVKNTIGDAIKTKDCNGITFRNVGTEWTGTVDENNGAYGIYPVLCQNVMIDNCYARGASDAGIYVGQSDLVIVKNSEASENVAGIEIENTTNADVFDNIAHHNTGGILVFDLPELTQYGSTTRVFNNTIQENNHPNFASAGAIVSEVLPGTGIMVLSTNNVEIFGNNLTNNNVMGVGLISYEVLERSYEDSNFNPYPQGISIHDNTFARSTEIPAQTTPIGALLVVQFPDQNIPDILYDGITSPDATGADSERICLSNNINAKFANLDVANLFSNLSLDDTDHQCTHESLSEVTVTAP